MFRGFMTVGKLILFHLTPVLGCFMTRLVPAVHVSCALIAVSSHAAQPFEFTRMVAHWADYADPGYLSFIDDAKPDVVQVGFYGGHFWSCLLYTSDAADERSSV